MMNSHRLSNAELFLPPFYTVGFFLISALSFITCLRVIYTRAPSLLELQPLAAGKCPHRRSKKFFLRGGSFFLLASLIFLPLNTALAKDDKNQGRQTHLEAQLSALRQGISLNPEVIRSVVKANLENVHFTPQEITAIDQQWRKTEGVDLFIVSLITNELADQLKEFQEKQGGLAEIFITDQKGLLIASTNKTSDFYQGDELWWQEAFLRNDPNGSFGNREYDESALVEDIPLYLVIRGERSDVIGVLKAVSVKDKILTGAV